MFGFVWRQAKRLIILVVGLAVIWVHVRNIFPWLDDRLPLLLALSLTYILGAYLFVPVVIRGMRLIFRAKHIPHNTTTPDGFACDPVNIGVVGSEADLKKAMKMAGWSQADPRTLKSMSRMAVAYILKQPYPTAPFSNLYLFGRKQDIGFQKPVSNSPRARYHVRFWACATDSTNPIHQRHVQFWRQQPHGPRHSEQLWVGAATKDIGLAIIRHNAQFTHAIDPDTNAARDHLIKDLEDVHVVRKLKFIMAGEPTQIKNRALGITMIADGDLLLVHLQTNKRAGS